MHDGGHQHGPDDKRIHEYRRRHTKADQLDRSVGGEGECEEDDDHDRRERGDGALEVLRGRRHQPRQSGDQSAGLVEVAMRTRFRIP